MHFTGTLQLDAPRATTWQLLTDVEGLRSCGEAIKSIERLAPDLARVTAKVGSGFLAFTAPIEVRLVELVAEERAQLAARGSAAGTEIQAGGTVSLSGPPEGPTTIDYVADIELKGGLAGMATGFLERDGPKVLAETFECVRARLPRPPATPA
jgi:carbon monoxide dehydrogenase subunit G